MTALRFLEELLFDIFWQTLNLAKAIPKVPHKCIHIYVQTVMPYIWMKVDFVHLTC